MWGAGPRAGWKASSQASANSVLVAPLDVADGAFVAAGSTVVEDVPAGALAVARGRGHISKGWVQRRRAGTKAAAAAEGAAGQIHEAVADARARLEGSDQPDQEAQQ